jgi:lipid-A-disaccharide synthase
MMVAGEASGDMHAAKVIEALRRRNKDLRIFGMGGPRMKAAGMEVREDPTRQALMGLAEVVRHLPESLRRLKDCERWLREEKPDLLFTVDYPDFNLRLARKAHALGVPTCHYVAPSLWAWRKGRLKSLRRILDKLLVILPFEKEFFRREGMEVSYVGNPLPEEMDLGPVKRIPTLQKSGLPVTAFPLVCAMPGSRKAEVGRIWPLFLKASRLLRKSCPDAAFLVPRPHGLEPEDYPDLAPEDPFYFVEGPAYDLRKACDLAWVKSGTGTLETALLGTPLVVVYKVSAITGFLAKRLLKVKDVSLVNLLAGKRVAAELLQERATPENLLAETDRILEEKGFREKQARAFRAIRRDIARPSRASRNAAAEVLRLLSRPPSVRRAP